ncbi:hypothetical protein AMS68_007727 [Peltaster fructicola]|uniref:Major facilitator superfamily (MFS) profile domain-containing protein n=1 Tax=Peltaster fructicola TaxID=286661 RepID=A0A6H0Y6I2_9PEZI|nr:hypothetical protein AMS68_007727 [Peltaster fructicola]
MDLERGASRQEEKEEAIDSDDSSSVFSWHHAEGPRSLRRMSTSRSAIREVPDRTLSRMQTIDRSISKLTRRTTTFQHPLTQEKTSTDVLVHFDGPDDPYRPLNWPFRRKAVITLLYGFLAMTTSFASAVFSAAVGSVAEEFSVSAEVATLGIALLLFGLGLGPLIFAPASEVYGRKWCVLLPVFVSACFTFGGAVAKDIQTLMICRFFMGFFGSAPVTNTGGVLGDIWAPKSRGLALIGYSIAVVGGPTVGPLIGSAMTESYLGWRWTQYLTGIMQMSMVLLGVIFIEETYPATLLTYKAKRLRIESGNWALHSEMEEWDVSISELGHKYLVRPIKILCTPIGALMIFYASFCYGLIYACLGAFPIIFEDYYGWTPVQASLPFLAELIGIFGGCAINATNQNRYARKMQENGGQAVPEARLYPMMFGSPLLTAGIFMLAWTAEYRVFWVAPCIAIILIGTGFFTIFQGALNYLIDTFLSKSASAIAANTFVRSVLAGSFPLFLTYQLYGIGVGWGLSVYGFIAAALLPVPYVFFIYGARIRAHGAYNKIE